MLAPFDESEANSVPEPSIRRLGDRNSLIFALLTAFLVHLAWYAQGIAHGGFANLDVAGIAYNARLLLDGQLPYVGSAEVKPPGTFFLFAALLSMGSMRLVWIFAVIWATLASYATGRLAGAIWGQRVVPLAILLHAGGSLVATEGDINYSFWATLPFTAAAAMSLGDGTKRRRWFLIGAIAAFSFLFKQSTVLLLFVLMLGIWQEFAHTRSFKRSLLRPTVHGFLGAGLVFGALALPYLLQGELAALLAGLGFSGGWWVSYAETAASSSGNVAWALLDGIRCIGEKHYLGSSLVLLAVIPFSGRWRRFPGDLPALVFLLAALGGVAATMRFYPHHLAQLWPALVVLGLRPSGPIHWLLNDRLRGALLPAAAALGLGVLASTHFWIQGRNDYIFERDQVVMDVCEELAPHLGDSDSVLALGWPAWSIYEHCGRRAPGPIYKDITFIITANTNTCMRRSDPVSLLPGPAADRYLADFDQNRPSAVLWYREHLPGADPAKDWDDLSARLGGYVETPITQRFVLFVRPDLASRIDVVGRRESRRQASLR